LVCSPRFDKQPEAGRLAARFREGVENEPFFFEGNINRQHHWRFVPKMERSARRGSAGPVSATSLIEIQAARHCDAFLGHSHFAKPKSAGVVMNAKPENPRMPAASFEQRAVQRSGTPHVDGADWNPLRSGEQGSLPRNAPSAVKQENMADLQPAEETPNDRGCAIWGGKNLLVSERCAEELKSAQPPGSDYQAYVRALRHDGLNQLSRGVELERCLSMYPERAPAKRKRQPTSFRQKAGGLA